MSLRNLTNSKALDKSTQKKRGINEVKRMFKLLKSANSGRLQEKHYDKFFNHACIGIFDFTDIFGDLKSRVSFCKYLLQNQKDALLKIDNRKHLFEMLEEHPKEYGLWMKAVDLLLENGLREGEEERLANLLSSNLKVDDDNGINDEFCAIFDVIKYHKHTEKFISFEEKVAS